MKKYFIWCRLIKNRFIHLPKRFMGETCWNLFLSSTLFIVGSGSANDSDTTRFGSTILCAETRRFTRLRAYCHTNARTLTVPINLVMHPVFQLWLRYRRELACRGLNRWRNGDRNCTQLESLTGDAIALLYVTKFSTISLYLTKLYVTYSFTIASSVKYCTAKSAQNLFNSAWSMVNCCLLTLRGARENYCKSLNRFYIKSPTIFKTDTFLC